jgi:hypothetical protein
MILLKQPKVLAIPSIKRFFKNPHFLLKKQ